MTTPTTSRGVYPNPAGTASDGVALTFETVGTFEGASAPLRVRPAEWTLLRVVHGVLRLTVGNVERVLHAGEEAIVAAVTGEARYVMGVRTTPLS